MTPIELAMMKVTSIVTDTAKDIVVDKVKDVATDKLFDGFGLSSNKKKKNKQELLYEGFLHNEAVKESANKTFKEKEKGNDGFLSDMSFDMAVDDIEIDLDDNLLKKPSYGMKIVANRKKRKTKKKGRKK